ncbi:uncharacterized protein DUF1080 [Thermosporothrix hazakensis]|jgi:hypothetical protein|uniref:Uncharacterized protein DUF1080 n=2 Tax=Thermosporothrix TaxID=768650 RepID=A0A326UF72_THEHA|nr:zinc-ribbon domain-containing protein [Thermosporothrix hazakensis]PZW36565.1 uncharacterized protein DUF1080 [Thermosporothrix hazakensis]BBH89032.1 hypothetical protein KTC_37830 [Thermosporothrix sp. COM3]GCE47216.1 hypothetical protein KTH_20850 [Thermosporothrix hazakensis]
MQYCINCGQPLRPGASFCTNCGYQNPGTPSTPGFSSNDYSAQTVASPPPVAQQDFPAPPPLSQPPSSQGSGANHQPLHETYSTIPAPIDSNQAYQETASSYATEAAYGSSPNYPNVQAPNQFGSAANYPQQTPNHPGSAANYPQPTPSQFGPVASYPHHTPGQFGSAANYPPQQFSGSSPYNAPSQGSFPTPPQPPKKKRTALIAISAALALLLILGAIVTFGVIIPNQVQADQTATAQKTVTAQNQATGTANAQVTGTSVAQAHATSTAQAQATANAVATQTTLQSLYTQATGGKPVLSSPLAANDSANWNVGKTNDGGGCNFSDGQYHSTLNKEKYFLTCYAQKTDYANFAIEVEMTIVKGDAGGLVLRGDAKGGNAYLFSFKSDGTYAVHVEKNSSFKGSILTNHTDMMRTGSGETNTITVIAQGDTMYLYINKRYVDSVVDSTYSSGQVGVFCDAESQPTDVAFKNFKVWNL